MLESSCHGSYIDAPLPLGSNSLTQPIAPLQQSFSSSKSQYKLNDKKVLETIIEEENSNQIAYEDLEKVLSQDIPDVPDQEQHLFEVERALPQIKLKNKAYAKYLQHDEQLIDFINNGIYYDCSKWSIREKLMVQDNQVSTKKILILEEVLHEYFKAGYLEKAEPSELIAVSPLSLVPKSNGTWRLIFDGKQINKLFTPLKMKMVTPLSPLYHCKKYFAKMDFSNAFMHFELREDFRKWFGVHLNGNTYRFTRMPFGWNMAPSLCQRLFEPINKALRIRFPGL